jgi:uncharacterized membrane protein YedE/YeeE
MNNEWLLALLGGVGIGIAVSLMLLLNGRVTGISGILNGVLVPAKNDTMWRVLLIAGLIVGGFVINVLRPESFVDTSATGLAQVIFAGLLVGFGTVMGGGCTSGHGVCGVSRMSIRSLVATGTFILAGILSVWILRFFVGGL